MLRHALDRGYEVVGVCREQSVHTLEEFAGRITVVPGATNDAEVIRRAVAGCDGVLVVLVPWGVHRDGQDVYPWRLTATAKVFGPLAWLVRFADLDDQVEACRRVFASDTRWTVARGSDLEEGESQGLPV
jgi:nucleoside-diphosphate-sugar epimerase